MIEKEFEEYLNKYKILSLKEKQNVVIEQLKMLSVLTNQMCTNLNVKNEILLSKELVDLKNENYTEDDFSEAILTLVNSIQNSLCDFNLKLVDIMKYIETKQ